VCKRAGRRADAGAVGRTLAGRARRSATTQLAPGLTLARLLGDDSETVMAVARQLWLAARAGFGEDDPIAPRIWAT
jgi:urease accessory protein UreH